MNNRGQVLVVFLLTLPLILLIFAAIIDNGYTYIAKRKIENEIKAAIRYRFTTEDDENIIVGRIKSNLEQYDKTNKVFLSENYITVKVEYERKNLFGFLNKSATKIIVSYHGTIENDEIIIRKD